MRRNSTEAVRQGRLQPFKGTGHFPSDSPTDNQLDIGASVADNRTGGSACPGALVAAGKDFASFFLRSAWFSWAVGILHENNPVHPSGCSFLVPEFPNPLKTLNPARELFFNLWSSNGVHSPFWTVKPPVDAIDAQVRRLDRNAQV